MTKYTTDLPGAADFQRLYLTTGWGNQDRTLEWFEAALNGSWFAVSVYEERQLIGFGRIISDGAIHAFITEMMVHPDHQGRGIGQEVLARLVEHCKTNGIRDIQLFCASGKQDFYLKQDFVPRPGDAPGMEWKFKYG